MLVFWYVLASACVLRQAEIYGVESSLLKYPLCWTGCISRGGDKCFPTITLFGDLSFGRLEPEVSKRSTDILMEMLLL